MQGAMSRALALVSVVCITAAGCASEPNSGANSTPQAAARAFVSAYQGRDYGRACSLLTTDARKGFRETALQYGVDQMRGTTRAGKHELQRANQAITTCEGSLRLLYPAAP